MTIETETNTETETKPSDAAAPQNGTAKAPRTRSRKAVAAPAKGKGTRQVIRYRITCNSDGCDFKTTLEQSTRSAEILYQRHAIDLKAGHATREKFEVQRTVNLIPVK